MVTKYAKDWQRVSGLSCICFTLVLLLTSGLCAQETQQLTQSEFNSALEIALSQNDEEELDNLIRTNRLFVKPFTNSLITEVIQLELQGDTSAAIRSELYAGKCASLFEAIHGERNLTIAVEYLQTWTSEQKQSKLKADDLYSMGTRYRLQREPDSALMYYNRALELYRGIGDERGEGEVLGGIGAVYFNPEDYEKALDYYQEALRKRTGVDDRQLAGATLNGLGSVYLSFIGDFTQAINYYSRAEALREEIGDLAGLNTTRLYKATAYMNLAEELTRSARYPEALEHLEKALELNRKISANTRIGETLNKTGYIYYKTGDYSRAAEILTEAVRIMKEENDEKGLAGVYNHFGLVLQAAGRAERALGYFSESLKIYEGLEDIADMLPVMNNMGTLFFDMGDHEGAEELYLKGLKLSRETGDRELEVAFLLNLANNFTSTGRLDEAMLNYQSAKAVAEKEQNPDLLWRITVSMAENHERRGDLENAIALNDSALLIIETIRNTLQDKDLKASFLSRERYVFEDIINMLAALHETDPAGGYDKLAFRYAENCKSRVLLDLLGESRSSAGKEVLSAEDDQIVTPVPAISLNEVQTMLPGNNCVVLEYSVGDSTSCLWVITKSGVGTFRLPGRRQLQEQIETIRFAISNPSQVETLFFSPTATELYRELISPAEPFLTSKSNLVIIPDDILNYLPFEVLLTNGETDSSLNSYSDLPFLIRKYPINYVQSATILKTLLSSRTEQPKRRNSAILIAFGDPDYGNINDLTGSGPAKYHRLEYSGREVEAIASFFRKGSALLYTREEATEENIKLNDRLGDADYLHFATHGIVDETNPDLSALMLAQGNGSAEDGLLEAKEIFNLEINAGLVVLSACQTGLGKLVRGEGMVGLTRAFMYAGTPSVLVSLWSVSDNSTAILMGEFYKNLMHSKQNKTEALRKAQISLIGDPHFAHPFYWAPFVLIGDWR